MFFIFFSRAQGAVNGESFSTCGAPRQAARTSRSILAEGRHAELSWLPTRTGASNRGGTWLVRYYGGYAQKQVFHALGELADVKPHAQFDAASSLARNWLDHVAGGGSTDPVTVAGACMKYIEGGAPRDQAMRLSRLIPDHPIADVLLSKLTRGDVQAWRKYVEQLPALVTRNKGGQQRTRPRSSATLNRDMVPLRAALNLALENGYVLSA